MRTIYDRLRRRPDLRPDVLVEDEVELYGCTLIGPIEVGYRSYANDSLIRNATIGRFCSIGRRCSIGAARHDVAAFSSHPVAAAAGFVSDPATTIGHDVWIGDNALVVAGVGIGDGAVIGGGTVVTRDVAPYAIVGGSPARLIRMRFDAALAEALLASHWWRYGDAALALAGDDRDPRALLAALAVERPAERASAFHPWRGR